MYCLEFCVHRCLHFSPKRCVRHLIRIQLEKEKRRIKKLNSQEIVWKITHAPFSVSENSGQLGNSRIPIDIYETGYGTEDRMCPDIRTAFTNIVM